MSLFKIKESSIGSPPHTWRIQYGTEVFSASDRITSTYVENTSWLPLFSASTKDHLHIRGEYSVTVSPTPIASRITSTYVENT